MPVPCPYCARLMDGRRPTASTSPTRDHVIPQCLGGTRVVLVCRRCNLDKASTPIATWLVLLERRGDKRAPHVAAFIQANPWVLVPILVGDLQ